MMAAPITLLPGDRYGRWVILGIERAKGRRGWRCQCDCGETAVIVTHNLCSGRSKSCGCHITTELRSARAITHGASSRARHPKGAARSYNIWCAMRSRCLRETDSSWEQYGGRGITVCERWLRYENFIADMGEPPPGHTIERLNNDAGYHPGNCAWVDRKTQARNRRTTVYISILGEEVPVITACEKYGVSYRYVNSLAHKCTKPGGPKRGYVGAFILAFSRSRKIAISDAEQTLAAIGIVAP